LGPSKEYATTCPGQTPRGRKRQCLLKGCEKPFLPTTPWQRYCCPECAEAARRWSQTCANRRYRASENGKCRRREQACRYRERVRQCQNQRDPPPEPEREGYKRRLPEGFSYCRRPGCYESFPFSPRSPDRKFCCHSCRNALRRVLRRERYWRRILRPSYRDSRIRFDTS
jgi:hypothetical protein